MAQISLHPRFCTRCGVVLKAEDSCCTKCGLVRNKDDDATVRLNPAGWDATVRLKPADPDATVRVKSPLLSRTYLQAARQQALVLAEQTEPLPELAAPVQTQSRKAQRSRRRYSKKALLLIACSIGVILLLLVPVVSMVVDHGHYGSAQQQAQRNKAQLDHLLQHAQASGVSASQLQPLLSQAQQTGMVARLLTLFPNPAGTNVYQRQAQLYQHLQKQVPGVIAAATQQAQSQATLDLQNFQTALGRANMQPQSSTHFFSQQFSQEQLLVASAHTPAEYGVISQNARKAVSALLLQSSTYQQITDFHDTLSKMQAAHIDVTAMQAQYQHDTENFASATQAGDFQNLSAQLAAQYQQLLVISVQAFSYVSATKLNELTGQIQTLQSYSIDARNYQKRLDADQVASDQAKTLNDELTFFKQVDVDIAAMHSDLVHGQAHYLVAQYQQEVNSWSQAHPYHDPKDGHDYALDNGYMQPGIGAIINSDLAHASSLVDEEAVITEVQNAMFNLHALEADYGDQAPFDQPHATDQLMLEHYQLQQKQVLMISLVEQSMRIYQGGKLVRSYQITAGRQALPSLPGVWSVLDRKSPIIFTAGEPKSSPYWFPDTPISYAILYHYGGYYVHDAPWRGSFGPGTQFPHQDAAGTTSFNFDGSHGCINLPESATAWVYNNTDWNTVIAIY